MRSCRHFRWLATAYVLTLAASSLGWSAQPGLTERLIWHWKSGDCNGLPGGILQEQWIDAAPGSELCVVPPSYLCTDSSGALVRWYVDIAIEGQMFPGTSDSAIEHCVRTSGRLVTVHSSTYCTTFPTRYAGKITFECAVGQSTVARSGKRLQQQPRSLGPCPPL